MPVDEYSLRHYVAANGKRPFAEWLCSLADRNAVDVGPGYRVYFIVEGHSIVVLLCGGDKTTQQKDIRRAREYLTDYRRRPDA
jgi:hypothetical protein